MAEFRSKGVIAPIITPVRIGTGNVGLCRVDQYRPLLKSNFHLSETNVCRFDWLLWALPIQPDVVEVHRSWATGRRAALGA
ncbi:MAG: hypothetical protein ACYTGS_18120, partial [Planctomycetota bacterium]